MAAMAARRSETFIGAKHRARLARMDTPVAIKATARELACLIYLMVTEGQEYVEQGIDAYEKRRLNRKFAHLDRQAQKLGFQLIPKTQGEEKQSWVVTLQSRPTAPGDDSDRLHVEFSRLLCDYGHAASCRAGTGKTQDSRGLTAGRLPVWMRHRV